MRLTEEKNEKMKKKVLITILIFALLLAACSGGGNTATVEPTAVPPTEQPAEPTAASSVEETAPPAGTTSAGLDALTATTWMWVGFTNPVEQYSVESPENYTLSFQDDGTVNIKADCNDAVGSYTVDGSSIKIGVGPMTLAACPPESLGDDFVKYLGFAAIYFFEDGNLFIDLFADGGTLEFAPAGEAGAAGSGPVTIVGEVTSANFAISPNPYPNPTVVLTDM